MRADRSLHKIYIGITAYFIRDGKNMADALLYARVREPDFALLSWVLDWSKLDN